MRPFRTRRSSGDRLLSSRRGWPAPSQPQFGPPPGPRTGPRAARAGGAGLGKRQRVVPDRHRVCGRRASSGHVRSAGRSLIHSLRGLLRSFERPATLHIDSDRRRRDRLSGAAALLRWLSAPPHTLQLAGRAGTPWRMGSEHWHKRGPGARPSKGSRCRLLPHLTCSPPCGCAKATQ